MCVVLFVIKKMDLKHKFWLRIKELRKEKWLSQEDLWDKAWLHRTYIWMIERWEKNVCIENIEKLSKALKVNVKDLFIN